MNDNKNDDDSSDSDEAKGIWAYEVDSRDQNYNKVIKCNVTNKSYIYYDQE